VAELAHLADPMTPARRGGGPPRRAGPVTVRDIVQVTFRPSPVAWRGYSPIEVKEVLDAAAASLRDNEDECQGLAAEIERLRNFYRNHPRAVAALPAAGTDVGGLVGTVRRYAPTQVQHAADYAERAADGSPEADRLLKHARMHTTIVVAAAAGASPAGASTAGPERPEAEQAQLWISCFAHALRTQAAALYDAVSRHAAGS
jgi:DivIVA domain-containing protein